MDAAYWLLKKEIQCIRPEEDAKGCPPGVALLQGHIGTAGAAGGQPKVSQLEGALLRCVDVVRLHVHVHNAARMQVLQRLCHLATTSQHINQHCQTMCRKWSRLPGACCLIDTQGASKI
jgi:hypothetical protein